MKDGRKKSGPVLPPVRTFNLHARFTPEGPDVEDECAFADFTAAALARSQKFRKRELAQEKARFAKLKAADRRVTPIVLKLLRSEISLENAIRKFKRLVPDKVLTREAFDIWDKAVKATPDQVAMEKEDIARREVELAQSGRLLKARKTILVAFTAIFDTAMAGDAKAANELADVAIEAAFFLYLLEKNHPELVEPIARRQMQWPVLANEETGWEKDAVRRVAGLELGADLRWLRVRFRRARGTDANLPARLWAKAAVRTIEETRFRLLLFGQLLRAFGTHKSLADFCLQNGWGMSEEPPWVSDAASLEAFSRESLLAWKRVIRAMIREQVPNFHLRPDWASQCNSAAASGRDTTGEIQNAILDDFVSALARLAPDKAC